MSGEDARLFIAAEAPEAVRVAYASLRESLARRLPAARWVRADGIHLTLKFLGGVPRARIGELGEALAAAMKPVVPFALATGAPGLFGSPRRPRVLWVALEGDVAAASSLASAVEAAIAPLGFPTEDRPFRPHLTLARFATDGAGPVGEDLLRDLDAGLRWRPFAVEAIALVESLLGRGGSRYEARRQCPLEGARS